MTTDISLPDERSKRFILGSICLAALVLPLSFTGGAVAIPAISRALGGSPTALTWVTNAFMLSFGSLLMAAGALADQFGRKRVFSMGILLYTIVSVALSFAPSVPWLDALRAVQGVAAAAALAGGSAALAQEFEAHARTRAFSMLGATFGVGLAFGPLVAGALIEAFGWRSIFLTTAALGALSLAFGVPRLRETRDPGATGLDWPGTLTFTGTLATFTFGIIQAPESGWGSPLVVGMLAASALLLLVFILVELRVKRPMLDLTLLRYGRFVGVQMLPVGTCYSYIVLVVFLPLRLIGVEQMTEFQAGLLMLALSTPMLVVPLIAATLTRWVQAGILSGIGFLIAAVGVSWLGTLHVGAPVQGMIGPMLLIGIGSGLPWGLMDGLAVSVVPKERAGMATGIFNTARVAGEGITIAIVSAVLAGLSQTSLRNLIGQAGAGRTMPVAEAAQRLTTGSFEQAASLLPGVARSVLVTSYDDAFRGLLHVLTAVTVLAALAAFGFLGKRRRSDEAALVDARAGC